MTKGLGLRQYRACIRCRSRKTRCDLQSVGEPGKPPCAKCVREGAECVLASSRRGGDFSHLRKTRQDGKKLRHESALSVSSTDHVSPRQAKTGDDSVHDNLQNPSDALLILAHAAGQPGDRARPDASASGLSPDVRSRSVGFGVQTSASPAQAMGAGAAVDGQPSCDAAKPDEASISTYPLVQDRTLEPALLIQLLRQYADKYHHFLPIVPSSALRPECIIDTIKHESFLLTSILVVASKDQPDLAELHKSIWDYMRRLILDVVLGMASIRNVGCVEGLLLLGEWTLLNQGQTDDGGEGAAWSILGLAVRLAYLLRLEDSSFKGTDGKLDAGIQRERLAWTFTYLSDRQISIRMGQAFWCRGPALSARFTAQDFPALQPQNPHDEDFASLVQAQVELTTLFGNAHDILFASRSRTAELMVRGDYTKYVDDTSRAMAAWRHAWRSISISPHLRSCLTLMYEYLRLYVNAFAFQAVLYRASKRRESSSESDEDSRPTLFFPDSTMASPDARHIYEAVDAAETLLKIVTEDMDPQKHLRYMPARFYLYEIHSSVFLYKAHASGAISSGKHAQTAALMQSFISVLSAAAVDDSHIAARYAKLLDRLWFHGQPAATANADAHVEAGGVDTLASAMMGTDVGQVPLFDDLSLQPFDCTDTMDGLFAMPAFFPWDQTGL